MAHEATGDQVMRNVLKEYDLTRFYIEYDVFKSNHLLHGIVALHALGAERERLVSFAESYRGVLETAKPIETKLTGDEWRSVLGKKSRFTDLRVYFHGEMEARGGIEGAIKHYVPQLIDGGIACAAFHPIIHIGYGVIAGSVDDVADGLAYMVYAHRAPRPDLGQAAMAERINNPETPRLGQFLSLPPAAEDDAQPGLLRHPLCGLLRKVQRNERLQRVVSIVRERIQDRRAESVKETGLGPFSSGLALVQDHVLVDINRLLDESGLLDDVTDDSQLSKLFDMVLQGILILYSSTSKPDDFFLLHALTSSWAVRELLPHLSDFDARRTVVRLYCRDLLSAYVIQNMPSLVAWYTPADLPAWDDIKQHTVLKKDEHLLKVVMTCYRMEQEYGEDLLGVKVYRSVAAFKSGLCAWPPRS